MEDINLNLYRVFYIAAKSKTFVETSEKLCISQPAVSKHIKKLEDLLNTKLFYRDSKGLTLTKEGNELLEYVETSYNSLLAGQKIIVENHNLNKGNVVIGAPGHIASFYLLKLIRDFRKQYPGIIIQIINGSTSFLIEQLLQHKIDFIIDSSPIEFAFANMVIEPLMSFETCFITNDKSLGKKETKSLENYDYVMPYGRSAIRKNLEKELKQNNKKLPVVLEVETTDLIIQAVKYNIGIGYIVKEAAKQELENGDLFELKTPYKLPALELNLIYVRNYLTNGSKQFINNYIKK